MIGKEKEIPFGECRKILDEIHLMMEESSDLNKEYGAACERSNESGREYEASKSAFTAACGSFLQQGASGKTSDIEKLFLRLQHSYLELQTARRLRDVMQGRIADLSSAIEQRKAYLADICEHLFPLAR